MMDCAEIERFGKGIGNASRYRILEALTRDRKTVGELVKIAKLSQPAVSQHLKVLKSCGLVIDERRGKEVLYAIHTEHALHLLKNLVKEMKRTKVKQNKS